MKKQKQDSTQNTYKLCKCGNYFITFIDHKIEKVSEVCRKCVVK